MAIVGTSLLDSYLADKYEEDYFFAQGKFCEAGWAIWRRAWLKNDINMKDYSAENTNLIKGVFKDSRLHLYYLSMINKLYYSNNPPKECWRWQWICNILLSNGYYICPTRNMMRNIGIQGGAFFRE
ncbi:MAG: nucleotide-diphospho-sugar transferase [Chlamydiales bacterium]|jgi:hypothetical protein|nr:nucleotide-diphospho-sugar transferase [Chlamydiales bacterium]